MGQVINEAVFFIKNHAVSRQLLFSDFEALLNGLSTIPEYVDEDALAAYVVMNQYGETEAVVFFKIYFDEAGHADISWNVPVEKLAEKGASGPDLGGGPIRLVCASQCSNIMYVDDLWDPSMNPGTNDFIAIRRAVEDNRLRFKFEAKPEPKPEPVSGGDVDIPLLGGSAEEVPVLASDDEFPTVTVEPERRTKLARTLKEQRLRIRTLEKHKERTNEELDREQRIIVHAYKNEISTLKQNIEQIRVANERLQEKLTLRNEKYIDLQDKVARQARLVEELKARLKEAKSASHGGGIEQQKLEAEIVLLREQLDRRDIDLAFRSEREDMLRAELEELKDHVDTGPSPNELVEKLKETEVVYVAYHPGVGHLSMTSNEILQYAENPMAYVADKARVSEEVYREWLEHFEDPVCKHVDAAGDQCLATIKACESPTDFQHGITDCCDLHKLAL